MQVTHTDLTDCFCLITNSGNKIIKPSRYQTYMKGQQVHSNKPMSGAGSLSC